MTTTNDSSRENMLTVGDVQQLYKREQQQKPTLNNNEEDDETTTSTLTVAKCATTASTTAINDAQTTSISIFFCFFFPPLTSNPAQIVSVKIDGVLNFIRRFQHRSSKLAKGGIILEVG